MTRRARSAAWAFALLAIGMAACGGDSNARAGQAVVPYKLGTFEFDGRQFLGMVLDDVRVVNIVEANTAYEAEHDSAQKLPPPTDLIGLIARFETGWQARLAELAREASGMPGASYEHPLEHLAILPPVSPPLILNGGGNYSEHTEGIARQQQAQEGAAAAAPASQAVSAPGLWEREPGDTRDNPYLFIKSPTVVVGADDPIVMPRGRTQIDFECEFAVVVGRRAKYVSVEDAAGYIFGYTIEMDVSDRGGRGDRKMGGSDWLVGKNHDTFGPIGPFIVPKEFMPDPMNTRHVFTLNGEVMQDSNTNRMTHDIYELLSFASNNLSLPPGTIIAGGSPAGTNIERAEPRWMREGDVGVCSIEGIGTQTHTIVAAQ